MSADFERDHPGVAEWLKYIAHCDVLHRLGYWPAKRLPAGKWEGKWAGVHDQWANASINVGIDRTGYATRYCYETRQLAEAALLAWDGTGDPPGPWIKQKPQDRHGPWYEDPHA